MSLIGTYRQQSEGYRAFIPHPFPPKEGLVFSNDTLQLHSEAMRSLGKLDGITQLLPDLDFFLFMYVRKEATLSSQIEGTQATMIDAITAEATKDLTLPDDVDDILHYIQALNYGLKRINELPISLRFIREVHKRLMKGARSTHFAHPGEFRQSQNWIGGTSPKNASFVPPPVHEMKEALSDLEKFVHAKESDFLPLIKTAFIHAQFETIHPFLDGNGRTGRLLITFDLQLKKLLDQPVLYLSAFFKQHQQTYYSMLQKYHHGEIVPWINFFLEGVKTVADEAVEVSKRITQLREKDMEKLQSLGKRSASSSIIVLRNLYRLPIVDVSTIQKWTSFSSPGAQKIIDRFIQLRILIQSDKSVEYGRKYIYKKYLDIFQE